MSETPRNEAGKWTEQLMHLIYEHIKRDPSPNESHHYNKTYEKVYKFFKEIKGVK